MSGNNIWKHKANDAGWRFVDGHWAWSPVLYNTQKGANIVQVAAAQQQPTTAKIELQELAISKRLQHDSSKKGFHEIF